VFKGSEVAKCYDECDSTQGCYEMYCFDDVDTDDEQEDCQAIYDNLYYSCMGYYAWCELPDDSACRHAYSEYFDSSCYGKSELDVFKGSEMGKYSDECSYSAENCYQVHCFDDDDTDDDQVHCNDDDYSIQMMAMEYGVSVGGCWDVAEQCWCDEIRQHCPVTCGNCPENSMCENHDNTVIAMAIDLGYEIYGCEALRSYGVCDHYYPDEMRRYCPQSCDVCCHDDNEAVIQAARSIGYGISGCSDVAYYCFDSYYGSYVRSYCPDTCGQC